MERVWADGGYAGKLIAWVSSLCQWVLEIVKRHDDGKGFVAAHVALTALMSWPEFGEMLGGQFQDHPYGTVAGTVINEDADQIIDYLDQRHSERADADEHEQRAAELS